MRVPRGKCRNGGRPFQGIDTIDSFVIFKFFHIVEMEVAPFRALTHELLRLNCYHVIFVEMEVAPFRALTHTRMYTERRTSLCRNGGRPFQGIDTAATIAERIVVMLVEMEVAPFRALTQEFFKLGSSNLNL